MKKEQRPYQVIEQLRAIRFPIRQEIMDCLYANGSSTVPQLAKHLGVTPESLYPHIRYLQKVRLIQVTGERQTPRRPATLYNIAIRKQPMRYDLTDPEKRACYVDIAQAILRLTARDWEAAVLAGDVTVEGSKRDLNVGRLTAWLSDSELILFNQKIREIVQLIQKSKPAPDKRLLAVTFAIAPLGHRHKSGDES